MTISVSIRVSQGRSSSEPSLVLPWTLGVANPESVRCRFGGWSREGPGTVPRISGPLGWWSRGGPCPTPPPICFWSVAYDAARAAWDPDTGVPADRGHVHWRVGACGVVRRGEAARDYSECYSLVVAEWAIYQTDEVGDWLDGLARTDPDTAGQVDDAIYALSQGGPALGRPLVDAIAHSALRNLKELRPGSSGASEVRILFAFDPWRSAILLVAGDKAGVWRRWYTAAIPRAEQLYAVYLKERGEEEREREAGR